MKKRMLSLVLATFMLLSTAACATGGNAGSDAPDQQSSASASSTQESVSDASEVNNAQNEYSAEGLGGYKIGFFYSPPTDILSKSFRDTLDYCAKLTNCEMEYYDMTEWSAAAMTTAVESLVSNGCDAVIMIWGTSPAVFQYLNDNEIYYVGMTRSLTDEVALVTQDSQYCTGWIGDEGGSEGANYQVGYQLTEALSEQGCKSIAVVSASEGEQLHDERVMGVEAAASALGMEIIANYRGKDRATGFADILASFGDDLDGVVDTTGSDIGVAAIQAAGLSGKLKLAQADPAGDDTQQYLEQGLLTATMAGGGTYISNFYVQLFNALSGADRLFEEGSKIVPPYPGFIVTSAEEWAQADMYTLGDIPGGVLPDEILSLNSICAPGMTVEEREALWRSYISEEYWNINSIQERLSAYLS